MARTKISEYSETAADNTDINNINIAEGCAPSGINNAIREMMKQLKDFQSGTSGDPIVSTSTVTATKLVPTGNVTAGNGMYLPAANTVAFSTKGAERVRVDSNGNVGIGTDTPSALLDVNGTVKAATGFNGSLNGNASTATALQTARTINGTSFNGSANITTSNWGTARTLTIGNTGKSVNGSGNAAWTLAEIGAAASNATVNLTGNQTVGGIKTFSSTIRAANGSVSAPSYAFSSNTNMGMYRPGTNQIAFSTAGTERFRIFDTGGAAFAATNNVHGGLVHEISVIYPGGGTRFGLAMRALANNTTAVTFVGASNGVNGSISMGTSNVSYNTSSDYRLKNIEGPVENSGMYIDSLKPVQGTWKIDGSKFIGLIAHEAQEVSQTQVATGEKDGEMMQGMDYGNPEFVANIIAELQSLRFRVSELEKE